MSNFLINKILKFFLRPKFLTESDDACCFCISRESINGNWYYLKLVPCARYGVFPVMGYMNQQEIKEFDKKAINKQMQFMAMFQDGQTFNLSDFQQVLKEDYGKDLNKSTDKKDNVVYLSKIDKNKLN